MVDCPIQCVSIACKEPSWLETHESFLLTILASISALFGGLFAFFLKSRCKKIDCLCFKCDRDVIDLTASQVQIT